MIVGCLLMLGVLGVAYFVEYRLLESMDTPEAWLVAGVLAVGVTMFVGTLHGAWNAFRTALAPHSDPTSWRDGAKVRVGGIAQARGRTLRAPFSGREALAIEYAIEAADRMPDEYRTGGRGSKPAPRATSIEAVPFGLFAVNTYVAVTSTMWLQHFDDDKVVDRSRLPMAARLLATTVWTCGDHTNVVSFLRGPATESDGDIKVHFINEPAARSLIAPPGEPVAGRLVDGPSPDLDPREAEQVILQRLGHREWAMRERVLAPGMEVTVEGTYRSNPPRIDLGGWMDQAGSGIRPGQASATASREWWRSLAGAVVIGALVAAAHYFVYAGDGAHFKQWFDFGS